MYSRFKGKEDRGVDVVAAMGKLATSTRSLRLRLPLTPTPPPTPTLTPTLILILTRALALALALPLTRQAHQVGAPQRRWRRAIGSALATYNSP